MLMSLIIDNNTVKLLSNINTGANTLVINNTVVPESSWVGTGYYTVGNIKIAKIESNTGNIHCVKVNALNYKLVTKNVSSTIYAEDVIYGDTNVKAALDDIKDDLANQHPIGSVFLTVSNTNPSTWFGGTWERIGKGRAIVGVDENDTDFNAAEKTGGSKTNTLDISQVPSHRHVIPSLSGTASSTGSAHTHTTYAFYALEGSSSSYIRSVRSYSGDGNGLTANDGAHSHSVTTDASNTGYTGGNSSSITQPVNNLQPYIAVYIWKRTA